MYKYNTRLNVAYAKNTMSIICTRMKVLSKNTQFILIIVYYLIDSRAKKPTVTVLPMMCTKRLWTLAWPCKFEVYFRQIRSAPVCRLRMVM